MIRVAEMFAGVGGFRVGLEGYGKPGDALYMPPAGDFETVWANQWEPPGTEGKQFAWRCYESRFGAGSCVNRNIEDVLDDFEVGNCEIPDFDLLVGGFPCQDYSVSKPAPDAKGIEGKKGVLWWSIERMLHLKRPKYVLLENVDRLLKSPTAKRGRDFAIMLSCLAKLGYEVEWMVVNAADYGMPQRRRRVYVFARLRGAMAELGCISEAFPFELHGKSVEFDIPKDPYETSQTFGNTKKSPFMCYGRMAGGYVWTSDCKPRFNGIHRTIRDVMVSDSDVPGQYFISPESLERWEYLKGAKKEPRKAKNGFEYVYSEGPVAFPDDLDKPSRTILTSEGGSGPSRMKHVVRGDSGRLRRLVPDELDALQCFPKGWTEGMSDNRRAFCMGNALVTEIPHRIGVELAKSES